jgi:hypothetical protein
MPDIGVYRMETHSFYAANEIAATVDLIRNATRGNVAVPIRLRIEQRMRVAGGKTKKFPVVAVELRGATAGQILSGALRNLAIGDIADPRELMAGPTWDRLIADAGTEEELAGIVEEVHRAGLDTVEADRVAELARARWQELKAAHRPGLVDVDLPPNVDDLWVRILSLAPDGWTSGDVEAEFTRATGVAADAATAGDMQAYLDKVT